MTQDEILQIAGLVDKAVRPLSEKIDSMNALMDKRLAEIEQRLTTEIRKVADTTEVRHKSQVAWRSEMEMDVLDIKERLEKLEGRQRQ